MLFFVNRWILGFCKKIIMSIVVRQLALNLPMNNYLNEINDFVESLL